MARVLIIAYYFPPIGGIGSIRLSRFSTYLPEFGWEPVVVAPARTPHASDEGLLYPEDGVVRAHSFELSRLGSLPRPGRTGTADTARSPSPSRRGLRRRVQQLMFYPDAQVGWYPAAVAAGRRLLRRERFDVIYSSSNPITTHLIARTLAQRARLPWVAEFRDPWSDRLPEGHPHLRRAKRLEADIAKHASRVVVPTPTLAEFWGRRWGKVLDLIPNGHDLDVLRPAHSARPTLVHVGTYYPGRQSFRALWQALAQLAATRGAQVPDVLFIGDLPDEVRSETESAGISEHIRATGFMPHEEAMRVMQSGTMLIASGFAGEGPIDRGVIPAKLFEYLASGLPILYISTGVDDGAGVLLDQPGCFVVGREDVDGVASALHDGLDGRRFERDCEQFSRRSRTGALADVLNRAAAASRRDLA